MRSTKIFCNPVELIYSITTFSRYFKADGSITDHFFILLRALSGMRRHSH